MKQRDSSTTHSSEKPPFAEKMQNTRSPFDSDWHSQHSLTTPLTSSPGVNGGLDRSWYFPLHASMSSYNIANGMDTSVVDSRIRCFDPHLSFLQCNLRKLFLNEWRAVRTAHHRVLLFTLPHEDGHEQTMASSCECVRQQTQHSRNKTKHYSGEATASAPPAARGDASSPAPSPPPVRSQRSAARPR